MDEMFAQPVPETVLPCTPVVIEPVLTKEEAYARLIEAVDVLLQVKHGIPQEK